MSFILTNIGQLLTLKGAVEKKGRHIAPEDLSAISNASLVVNGQKVLWSGATEDLPKKFKKLKKVNAKGAMVLPGFVDSHTHLVFSGDRSQEFEMRLAGKTYQEIAQSGGGIINSVRPTREISEKDLLKISLERSKVFLKQGVTTFEVKTGYGLTFEAELKCLKVIEKLKKLSGATVFSTFLGAHAVPQEYKNRKREYIEEISKNWLPKFKKLANFVDIFLDEGYFDKDDAEVLFNTAKKLNIPTKIHADELALTGGTETAIKFQSLSADHLLKITDHEIDLLVQNETAATLLPTTAFFLKTNYAPARKLLDRGARVALATDFNPGTSPTQDISLVGILSALNMNMRIDEIIVALTLNGAYALGVENTKGALLPGYDADFFIIDAKSPAKLFYEFGKSGSGPIRVFSKGKWQA